MASLRTLETNTLPGRSRRNRPGEVSQIAMMVTVCIVACGGCGDFNPIADSISKNNSSNPSASRPQTTASVDDEQPVAASSSTSGGSRGATPQVGVPGRRDSGTSYQPSDPQRNTGSLVTGSSESRASSYGSSLKRVKLTRLVSLPQTGPNGTLMSFSMEYEFVQGSPSVNNEYVMKLESRKGLVTEISVGRMDRKGALVGLVDRWRPEHGPFTCMLVERLPNGFDQTISSREEFP